MKCEMEILQKNRHPLDKGNISCKVCGVIGKGKSDLSIKYAHSCSSPILPS